MSRKVYQRIINCAIIEGGVSLVVGAKMDEFPCVLALKKCTSCFIINVFNNTTF